MHKKLIKVGRDLPSPSHVKDNMNLIQARPFDGIAVRFPRELGRGDIFDVAYWQSIASTRQRLQETQLDILSSIGWGECLGDNFLVIHGASTMDWFSDADWDDVLSHVRFCARAARAGRCKGLLWDPEPYGNINPWVYTQQPEYEKRSFSDYEEMVRRRGGQFIAALQEEFPGIHLLAMRILSDFAVGSPFSNRLLAEHDPAKRKKGMTTTYYGLHPAFFNGMLDELAPEAMITDANEDAYYYTSEMEYYRIYHALRQDALTLVAGEHHRRYASQVGIGHAVSIDYVVGNWANAIKAFPPRLRRQALYLSPEEQMKWFEHNTYHALRTADQYVWLWSEDMDWWTGRNIPDGAVEAVQSAKSRLERHEPLGFGVEEMLLEAQARAAAVGDPDTE